MKRPSQLINSIFLIAIIFLIFFPQPGQSMSKRQDRMIRTLYQQRHNLKLCYEEGEEKFGSFNEFKQNISLYQLNDQQNLIQVLCHFAAYQGVYEYYIFEIYNLKSVVFDTLDFSIESSRKMIKTRPLVGLPEYQTQTQSLVLWSKGRGVGDCGSWSRYQWDNSQFNLVEYREKSECDGVFVQPNEYPLVYP